MRFSLRQVIVALPVLVAALPASTDPQHVHHIAPQGPARPNVIELDVNHDHPKALFEVPCPGCLGTSSEAEDGDNLNAVLFDFKALPPPTNDACGAVNVVVNGESLDQNWDGFQYVGVTTVPSLSQPSFALQHRLGLAYNSSCLTALDTTGRSTTVQVLTVSLLSIDGLSVHKPSGFTISFKPHWPLKLLRLSPTPDSTARNEECAQSWVDPPAHLRLISPDLASVNDVAAGDSSLDEQIDELKRLQSEQARIERLIQQQKSLIEGHAETNTIIQCRSITCCISKFFSDAKSTLEDIYTTKIKPAFAPSQSQRPLQVPFGSSEEHPDDEVNRVTGDHFITGYPTPASTPSVHFPIYTPSVNSTGSRITISSFTKSDNPSENIDPFTLTLIIVGTISCLTVFLVTIRRSCCNPRAQAERATNREQRRTERAYRRAARKHRFKTWWSSWAGRWKDQQRITDYAEKRAMIQQQEHVLETAMQDEVRLLRAAHDAVSSILHTNSSSSGTVRPFGTAPVPNMSHHPRPHYEADIEAWQNVPLSRTSSLPDYRSEAGSSQINSEQPPPYSDDEGDIVANGFRGYRPRRGTLGDDSDSEPPSPMARGYRWTPGSSVVSTSPRPSRETLRYI